MTELEQAIAEVKRGNETFGQATIVLRAVASGELIHATERDAAVAAALEEAAELRFVGCVGSAGFMPHVKTAILALINQPQAGALARIRADAVKIKPLVWHDCTDETSHDDGGRYKIEPRGKWFRLVRASTGPSTYMGSFDKRSGAKAAAQADYEALIRAEIGGVE